MQYHLLQTVPSSPVTKLFGDFESVKYYDIYKTPNSPKICNVDGIIVQKVTRTTECGPFDTGAHLSTNEAINAFTSNHVQNSNVSYYEYFEVKHGSSLFGDAFASGALTTYSLTGFPNVKKITYANGKTIYSAQSVFISRSNANIHTVLNLPWDTNAESPANGLPFITETTESNEWLTPLFHNYATNEYTNSNVAVHTLVATWSSKTPKTQIKQYYA